MQPKNISATLDAISLPRIDAYRRYFNAVDDYDAYGCYLWNEALASGLLPVVSSLEIALRNAIHRELSLHIGNACSVDWYARRQLNGRSQAAIEDITHEWSRITKNKVPRMPAPSPDDVVSRLQYGFWLATLRDRQFPWGALLPTVLPGHKIISKNYWNTHTRQTDVHERIDEVNRMRNRIAHHEPLWKFGAVYNKNNPHMSGKYQIMLLQSSSPVDSICRLNSFCCRAMELLSWVSPARADDLANSPAYGQLMWLCSEEGLLAYRQLKASTQIPLARARRELRRLLKERAPLKISCRGSHLATIFPV